MLTRPGKSSGGEHDRVSAMPTGKLRGTSPGVITTRIVIHIILCHDVAQFLFMCTSSYMTAGTCRPQIRMLKFFFANALPIPCQVLLSKV